MRTRGDSGKNRCQLVKQMVYFIFAVPGTTWNDIPPVNIHKGTKKKDGEEC